jgi:asparagine synthase (glutamine-hydrolysing)
MGCGICGFVGLSDKSLLRSMCDAIRHRGPDDADYYLDSDVGLGIDRLKIIDLATGDQPIHNEDGSVWVVFNGEIYNYLELKAELEKLGHAFYTASDTETIVHAYEAWGNDCVKHLRGMFAFALWDANTKRLFIARDRFGKKPLYYASDGEVFLFASELKSILQYRGLKRELDYGAVDLFFTYMYIPSPFSIFKQIRKLPPGCYATLKDHKLSISQYWDFAPRQDSSLTDEDKLVELLYTAIEDAVKVRMRSDVPLGAFLSGGIDSSTIVSLMTRLSDQPVKSVSIGFDNEISELPYSRKVAEFLSTDHREYIVSPEAFKILPKLIWHFDEPFADHSMIPTYYLSEVTRRDVTVALSGDGGDELFMGYPFLLDPKAYSLYSKMPGFIRRPSLRLLLALPINSRTKVMAKHAYEKGYADQSYDERFTMRVTLNDAQGLRNLYSRERLSLHSVMDTYDYYLGLTKGCTSSNDPLDAVDYATVRGYLEEDILVKVDRMSMAVSLEARCPLLDQEVAALVERIPSHLKMHNRETKYIFKKMAVKKGLVPKEIALRRKQGFGAPITSWMQKEWKEIVPQILDPVVTKGYTGLFDKERVRSYIDDPYLNSGRIFALMTFVMWYRMYMDEVQAKGQPKISVLS